MDCSARRHRCRGPDPSSPLSGQSADPPQAWAVPWSALPLPHCADAAADLAPRLRRRRLPNAVPFLLQLAESLQDHLAMWCLYVHNVHPFAQFARAGALEHLDIFEAVHAFWCVTPHALPLHCCLKDSIGHELRAILIWTHHLNPGLVWIKFSYNFNKC